MPDSLNITFTDSNTPLARPQDSLSLAEPVFRFKDTLATQKDTAATKTVTYINFYGTHEAPVVHRPMYNMYYHDLRPDWLFFILLLLIGSLAWIRYYYGKVFAHTIQAIFNLNIANQIVRDDNVLIQRTSALLGIIFNVVFAVVLYHLSKYYKWNIVYIESDFGKFLFFVLAVSAIYSFKFLLLKVLGFIFSLERAMANYIFTIFLINTLLGLLLIPVAVLLSFSTIQNKEILIVTAVGLYAISFIYRIFRGIIIGFSHQGVRLHYLFLYLCALEFAPLLVLLKILLQP